MHMQTVHKGKDSVVLVSTQYTLHTVHVSKNR
eukprot:COSAG02_NODE_65397_length_258_cov_0.647799_1_plen_31_part_01